MGKQHPTNDYELTTPDPQCNRKRNFIDGSGKGTDPQSVREGKKTQPKHITVNAITTTIPQWNNRTLRSLVNASKRHKALCE